MTLRFVVILLLGLAVAGCDGGTPSPRPAVGDLFPALHLPSLDGDTVPIERYRGRVVVLNVWATWCAPCREEMPSLQRLSDRFPAEQLVVLGLTVDQDLNLVREFLLKYGIRFPILVDPSGGLAEGVLGVRSYPDTLILAPDGRVAARVGGSRAWDGPEMVSLIAGLLAQERVPGS